MAKKATDPEAEAKPAKKTPEERVTALEQAVRALQDQLGVVKTV